MASPLVRQILSSSIRGPFRHSLIGGPRSFGAAAQGVGRVIRSDNSTAAAAKRIPDELRRRTRRRASSYRASFIHGLTG
jgi:hypothetical protein